MLLNTNALLTLASESAAVPGGLLLDLLILFGLALIVTFICDRIHVPAIVGFVITGTIAGPNALGLVSDVATVEIMAEIGVILLLFTLGIEFSLQSLLQIKIPFFVGGSLQLVLTGLATIGVSVLAHRPLNEAIFFGFLVSMSCTAIGLKMLQQRGELDSPHGRIAVGILLFQDFMVVPMVLITPMLAGKEVAEGQHSLVTQAFGGLALFGALFLAARYVIPKLFYQISAMKDRELFLLSVVVVGLAIAMMSERVGLSLAMGAFLAGLVISESEYSHRALGSILPFKEIFISLFFISVGMLLSVHAVWKNPAGILVLSCVVIALKLAMATVAVLLMRYPPRVALATAFTLSGIGEFSFVLSKAGREYGLMSETFFQEFLATSVLSLIVAPFFIALGPRLFAKLGIDKMRTDTDYTRKEQEALAASQLSDHIIIAGFGPTGRYVARAATAAGISYLIIEMNPQTVRTEREAGVPIFYGDAGQEVILEHAGIASARVLLLVIPDPTASRRITQIARELNPTIKIIVRVRFLTEIYPLLALGADDVITEEFETAVELVTRVMKRYMLPIEQIEHFVGQVRAEGYKMLRDAELQDAQRHDLHKYLSDIDINIIRLRDRPSMEGKSIAELDLRNRFGVTVLAIRRDGETIQNPDAKEKLQGGDELIVLGVPAMLSGMVRKLTGPAIPPVVEGT
ncbi:cation:proton antiporter [soil metagenome]